MKLRTSHGTFVVLGPRGELLHMPEPVDEHYKLIWAEIPPIRASGPLDFAIKKGPFARANLVVLPDGLIAFRRDRLYLCADARSSELRFDRDDIGPWEKFAIITAQGTVERRHAFDRPVASGIWCDLESVANSTRVAESATMQQFQELQVAKFDIVEEEYCYSPIIISYDKLKSFQDSIVHYYPTEFGITRKSTISINKDFNKYVVLTGGPCGLIFDRAGFYTNPWFIHYGGCPDFVKVEDGKYLIKFSDLDSVNTEYVEDFIFYDGNYFNYYHWWSECLVNFEIADLCLGYMPPAIIWNGKPWLSEWQLASLKLLGVEVVHRTSERADVVLIKQVTWVDAHRISHLPGFILRRLSHRVINALPESGAERKKIYIKRKSSRCVSNDIVVDEFLLDKGFHIVYNEDYTQEQQGLIFKSANYIIAAHGAGLTNMIFMTEGASIIELMPSAETRTFYWIMAEKLRHKYGVLICRSVDGHFDSAMDVDLEDLGRLIEMMDLHLGFSEPLAPKKEGGTSGHLLHE